MHDLGHVHIFSHENAPASKGEHTTFEHLEEAPCPLAELKECKTTFDYWKSKLDDVGRHDEHARFTGLREAIGKVQRDTNKAIDLSAKTIEDHKSLCHEMAARANGQPPHADDVLPKGAAVRKSCDALHQQIDVLQGALSGVSEQLVRLPADVDSGTAHHSLTDWWHDIWSKHHDSIRHIVVLSVHAVMLVVKVLITAHPVGYLVHGIVVPIGAEFLEWAEEAFKKAGNIIHHWINKHITHHEAHHEADSTLALIREKLPEKIKLIQEGLTNACNEIKRESLKIEEQMKTSRDTMHVEQAQAQAAAYILKCMSGPGGVRVVKAHKHAHQHWHFHFYAAKADGARQPLRDIQVIS